MHIPELAAQAEFSDVGPKKKVLYETPALTTMLVALRGGHEIPAHTVNSEVVMHVIKGEGSFYTGSGTHEVKEGNLVVCAPDEPHGIAAKTDMIVLVAKAGERLKEI